MKSAMEAAEDLPDRLITAQAQKALVALEKCYHVSESRSQLAEAQLARFNMWAANICVFGN